MKIFTLQFTAAEVRRIERAATRCGWKPSESARFARQALLNSVAAILASRPRSRRAPPDPKPRR